MADQQEKNKEYRIISTNRRARHDYFIDDVVEAGIVLAGSEVKSLRLGKASLVDSYAQIEAGEAWLINCHIPPYEQANRYAQEPERKRKLLMHRKEIGRLLGKITQKGFTLIPLRLYFKGSRVKVELGLCRGKAQYDKRQAIKDRDEKRILDREHNRKF
ncbi:SsrA-binding protein SmpB [Candidatus Sumerlaeota bacterium]|nr:SsrA-binding protein SmpB [Candidatus Sumerlaeota bacterium]